MNKEQIEQLERLERFYNAAKAICDPLDYAVRQKSLLYCLAEAVLEPLNEHRRKAEHDQHG